jgi:CCCH-type zinc finger
MSSEPSDHTLFGGHEGAVKWLARFLSQLPAAPQSPLPLLTAPVLDAFLTGAGHMLANKHPDEFKKYLDFIINDCLPRIDEGTIGKPSATRLRKTIQGNFDGFKNKLPGRALAELYFGADLTGSVSHGSMGGGVSQPSSFGASASSSAPRNPFAAPPSSSTNAAPYPFGGGSTTTANATTAAPSPFTSSAPTATGFGSSSSSSQNQPFVGGGQHPASAPITRAPFASPFGASTTAPAPSAAPIPSPFGPGLQVSSNTAPSGFGTPFGQQQQPQQQHQTGFAPATSASSGAPAGGVMGLFGGQQPAQQLSVFGNPAPTPAATTGFVFGSAAPVPSPFGNAATTGGGMGLFGQPAQAQQQQQQSPFGTPFGQQQQQQTGFAPAATGLFGPPAPPAPITSAFGQPAQQQSTFFGGGLGSNNAPVASPFGTAAPSSSPFGSQFGNNNAPAASPFASTASVVSSPFGGTFGSGTGQFGGGSSSNNNNNNTKAPCRFFAQGGCKYGSNCRFSHDTGFGGGGPGGGAFNSAPSPFSNFGGPRR